MALVFTTSLIIGLDHHRTLRVKDHHWTLRSNGLVDHGPHTLEELHAQNKIVVGIITLNESLPFHHPI